MRFLVFLPLFFLSVIAEKARFDHYRVYSVQIRNEDQRNSLNELELSREYNFWTDTRQIGWSCDIMVPPHLRDQFDQFLKKHNFEATVKINNVQRLIDEEELMYKTRMTDFMDWTRYHRLNETYSWLDELAKKYPQQVKVVLGGKSYEGRDIKGIEIKFGENLPGVLIEAGIHAREWISPAGTAWMVNQMLSGNVDPVFKKFNYLYFPHLNPDGYEYTWTHNRLWRKTRTPYEHKGRPCHGADPNRNFDFHWNEVGTSQNPCDETYSGPNAFSEVETKSFSSYLKKVAKSMNLDVFVLYHSFSQLLLYPWGYTDQPTKDDALFYKVAKASVEALKSVHGIKFAFGPVATTIYPTSGTSLEWYYNEFNATFSYVYEMRDRGVYGFFLPAKYIVPCGEEHLASLKEMLLQYQKLKQ